MFRWGLFWGLVLAPAGFLALLCGLGRDGAAGWVAETAAVGLLAAAGLSVHFFETGRRRRLGNARVGSGK